nr:hypothetical protein [Tanacetum cinerariifolium]
MECMADLLPDLQGEIVRYMKSIGHSIEISLSPQEANWAIGRPKAMMSSILAHIGQLKCSIFVPFITPNLSCVCKITSSSDSLREEIDIFTGTDDLMPPGIKSDDYDSEGDIYFLEELLNNDSILLPKIRELIPAVMNNIDELIEDECFDPEGGEIDVFANIEDDDFFPFIFGIRIFLPYLTYPEVSPSLLSTRSEDTIFDLGIST